MTSSTAQSTDWPARLLASLEQQWALVERLEQLARRQGELIEARKNDDLLKLLSERQQIIDRFLAMQASMSSVTENLDDQLEQIDPPQRGRIQQLIADIGSALDTVMKHDEHDRGTLQTSRNETKQEMTNLGTASRARQAYRGNAGAAARFADRQG